MSANVADFLLQRLRDWGVARVYGYPGDGINAIIGAFRRAENDPELIQVRHEEMAAFMACGHAKFTGEMAATSSGAKSTSSRSASRHVGMPSTASCVGRASPSTSANPTA
jgi:thiamine pyrophosphate-dependent acetolactate synthase large subunit-like protein